MALFLFNIFRELTIKPAFLYIVVPLMRDMRVLWENLSSPYIHQRKCSFYIASVFLFALSTLLCYSHADPSFLSMDNNHHE